MTTIGERVKEIREELRLSQEKFGEIFNAGKSYISAVEKDKSKLSQDSLVKLLLDYNVNLNYLLGGFSPMFLNENHKKSDEQLFKEFQEFMKKNK